VDARLCAIARCHDRGSMDQAGLRQGLPARFCQEDYPIVVAGEFSLRG
jgi:hypothetical protein